MKRLLVASSLALVCSTTPLLAQDSGLIAYAGVLTGYDDVSSASGGVRNSKPAIAYGAVLGLESNIGAKTRFGIEAEFMDSGAKSTLAIDALNSATVRYGHDMFIGVRGAYEFAPHLLGYIKAGYSNRRVAVDGTAAGLVGGVFAPVPFNYRHNLNGYRVATGVEYGSKVRARLEYRYTDYGGVDASADPLTPTLGIKSKSHQIVAGMLYGF